MSMPLFFSLLALILPLICSLSFSHSGKYDSTDYFGHFRELADSSALLLLRAMLNNDGTDVIVAVAWDTRVQTCNGKLGARCVCMLKVAGVFSSCVFESGLSVCQIII